MVRVIASVTSKIPGEAVRSALRKGNFPWYDPETGRVVPILPFELRSEWMDRLGKWLTGWIDRIGQWFRFLNGWRVPGVAGAGDLIVIGLLLLLLTVVLVVLLELLRRYRPLALADAEGGAVIAPGGARRIEGLPIRGLDFSDPWGEAQRLRARGDYAGAIVYLFAHQLLTLDRAGRVRLVPGRTARQLVRSLADRQLRGLVDPTLRLFESVYYGHRVPSTEAFEAVWRKALEFQSALPEEAAA